MKKILVTIFILLTFGLVVGVTTTGVEAKTRGQMVRGYSNGRTYYVYVPSGYQYQDEPKMIVMLHGTTQTANMFADATNMNYYAEQNNFLVLYPEQSYWANYSRAWNWFYGINQIRNGGEADKIANITRKVIADYNVDTDNVYVAGISAGGAMAVIMAVTYPDIYNGVGVMAGLEYNAALNLTYATTAMLYGGPSPTMQGKIAYNNMPSSYRKPIRAVVCHGTNDNVVNPINGSQVVTHFIRLNDYIDDGYLNDTYDDTNYVQTNHQVPNGRSYTKTEYFDVNNNSYIVKYDVNGMGHAWSGGIRNESYTDHLGPNLSQILVDYFLN